MKLMSSTCAQQRLERTTKAAIQRAQYSALNWHAKIAPKLQHIGRCYSWSSLSRLVLEPRCDNAIQFNLASDRILPAAPGEKDKPENFLGKTIDVEKPASLVVSLHPNGSIIFVASGHFSGHSGADHEAYILDFVSHAWELVGYQGLHKIKNI